MDLNSFSRNADLFCGSSWSYSGIIQKLSAMYCACQPQEGTLVYHDYCDCSSQKPPAMSVAQFSIDESRQTASDMKIFHQKSEQIPNANVSKHKLKQDKQSSKIVGKRSRKTTEIDIQQSLLNLRNQILNRRVTGFNRSQKRARSDNSKSLRRRSHYIGVSRNNDNWQALINVDQVKSYIGTFTDELEAAKAYDLYSVAIRGQEAALNFDYSAEEMLEIIEDYLKTRK
ncbi:unnamed protein product [Moneuplotes crassus]|uniref:AP2/ERF domain-containing protein n=1 Tax=Euplotes crassus TaxID=5936 RepID=A0AAD2D4P8_EUPCR|nr:unnamed protein product [Moneuplotes crassus]